MLPLGGSVAMRSTTTALTSGSRRETPVLWTTSPGNWTDVVGKNSPIHTYIQQHIHIHIQTCKYICIYNNPIKEITIRKQETLSMYEDTLQNMSYINTEYS